MIGALLLLIFAWLVVTFLILFGLVVAIAPFVLLVWFISFLLG